MSNVTLRIAGRNFTVACAPGEEAHVEVLGRMIDGKVGEAGAAAAQSEPRVLLYAALLLADELHEARQAANAQSGKDEPVASDGDGERLEAIALRLENLASRLEQEAGNA